MKQITRLAAFFSRTLRKEIVVPDGPRLTASQTKEHLIQKLKDIDTDRARLVTVRERAMGVVPVRFVSEYYRHSWSIFGPGQVDQFMQNFAEVEYDHLVELNDLDPHPDFDLMHVDPRSLKRLRVA